MTVLASLGALKDSDRARVGHKAWRLHLALQSGLPVPEGFCLDRSAFDLALAASPDRDEWEQAVAEGGVDLRFRLQVLAQRMALDETTSAALRERLHALRIDRAAVRSSQDDEDERPGSAAGAYVSVLDVPLDQIERAIARCWAGGFSPTYRGRGRLNAGTVLIQRYVAGRVSGIAFSRDPMGGEDTLITAAAGACAPVCSGESGIEHAMPREGDRGVHEMYPLRGEELTAVRDLALTCEALLGSPADVEWTFDGDRLMLLQLRPAEATRRVGGLRSCLVEDVPSDFPLLGSSDLHRAWSVKRKPLRMSAAAVGFERSDTRYVHIGEPTASSTIDALVPDLVEGWVEVVGSGGQHARRPRAELGSYLAQMRIGAGRPITVRVEGVVENDHCGFGAAENDEVVLEYAWGFYASIDRLGAQVGRFRVGEDGTVREHEAPVQSQAYLFDPAIGALALRDSSPKRLPERYLRRVAEGIRALGRKFPGARFEWVGIGTRSFIIDASFERGRLPTWQGNSRPLSEGIADAPVYRIADLSHLETIWPDQVSVWRSPDFFARLRETPKAALLPDAPKGDKYVVAAPYPAGILALLLDHAAGFVFERGSSLCHLAIILRHHGIPAYVVGPRYQTLAARARLRLPDDVA